jgi:ribonucleoside-diphosphate reductase alpha chain
MNSYNKQSLRFYTDIYKRNMYVIKRNGSRETVFFDKITSRINKLCYGLSTKVVPLKVARQVCQGVFKGVTTSELDELAAETAAQMTSQHSDYGKLGARIAVSNLHKNTLKSFSQTAELLYRYVEPQTGKPSSLLSETTYNTIVKNATLFDSAIVYSRDFEYDYFGYKTLERSYLLKLSGKIVERPQHMIMRVAIGIHGADVEEAIETYHLMSKGWFTHATPTLFNSGTPHPGLSSCFLLTMKENDSIEGIYKVLMDCAKISKEAGGIGLDVSSIRASGSYIRGTNGNSNGLVPMLRVFNMTARYVDQCFEPGTLVLSEHGSIPIGDISPNDKLLTADGTMQRVLEVVHHHYSGTMVEISPEYSVDTVRVTPEHPLYIIKAEGMLIKDIHRRLDMKLLKPEYVQAKHVKKDDLIGFPIPTFEQDAHGWSDDDFRFMGIMIGDGHINSILNEANICLNGAIRSGTTKFCEEYLGVRGIRQWREQSTIVFTPSANFKVTGQMIYDDTKKRIPSFVLHVPLPKVKAFLKGLMETFESTSDTCIRIEQTSRNVMEGIRYLCLRMGIPTSGVVRDRHGTNFSCTYDICIPKDLSVGDDVYVRDGMVYSRIASVEETEYEGETVDFLVENNHNYVVSHLGLVKNGGGKRKGAFAIYLPPWHADILDFLNLKKNQGSEDMRAKDLFYGLWISDLFMNRVEAGADWSLMCPNECPGLGDVYGAEFEALYLKYESEGKFRKTVPARQIWQAIITAQTESGSHYMLYKDAVNEKSMQKNIGVIRSSNLCVSGDTPIMTKTGYHPIAELQDQEVKVWNGEQWSDTVVRQTAEEAKMIRINFSDGAHIDCTEYHKFFVQNEYGKPAVETEAKALQVDDKMVKFELPEVDTFDMDEADNVPYAYTHGLFSADGTVHKNGNATLALYGEKMALLPYLAVRTTTGVPTKQNLINTALPYDMPAKFHVPTHGTVDNKLAWLAGFADGDGCIARNGTNESLQAASTDKGFLLQMRLMLQTMGVHAKVVHGRDAQETLLPDGNGGTKLYDCKEIWRLLVTSIGLQKLLELGWAPRRLKVERREPQRSARHFVKIVSIEEAQSGPTYCFNEPLRHMGVFNGILTGQCTEVVEHTSKDDTACCNLLSVALPKFVESGQFNHVRLGDIVGVAVRNLNKVIDVNLYAIPEAKNSNMKHRPIAIGVQGLADVFQLLRMPYTSALARVLNVQIFETMYYAALDASCTLAELHGAYSTFSGSPASQGILQYDMWNVTPSDRWPWAQLKQRIVKYGLRNSLLLALMPTASTSQILGNTEAFEPVTSNIYVRRTLAGEFVVVNSRLMEDLTQIKMWTPEVRRLLIANDGSIQAIQGIPEDVKEIYKTVWEMSGRDLLDMSADRGAFIDQTQSLNIYMASPNYSKITSSHFHAWRIGLKTGMYYLRTKESSSAQKTTIDQAIQEDTTLTDSDQEYHSGCLDWMEEEQEEIPKMRTKKKEALLCSMDNQEDCISCGS